MSKGTNKESPTITFMYIPLDSGCKDVFYQLSMIKDPLNPNPIYHLAISNLLMDHSGIRTPSEPVFFCPPNVG